MEQIKAKLISYEAVNEGYDLDFVADKMGYRVKLRPKKYDSDERNNKFFEVMETLFNNDIESALNKDFILYAYDTYTSLYETASGSSNFTKKDITTKAGVEVDAKIKEVVLTDSYIKVTFETGFKGKKPEGKEEENILLDIYYQFTDFKTKLIFPVKRNAEINKFNELWSSDIENDTESLVGRTCTLSWAKSGKGRALEIIVK